MIWCCSIGFGVWVCLGVGVELGGWLPFVVFVLVVFGVSFEY